MTPCYYCELDRETYCKICIHGDGDSYIERLQTEVAALKEAIKQQGEPVAIVDHYRMNDMRWLVDRIPQHDTKLYTSAPSIPEGWLKICADELVRSTLTSHPLKFAFAKEHGLTGLDEVHVWMHTANHVFKNMVEKAFAAAPSYKGEQP